MSKKQGPLFFVDPDPAAPPGTKGPDAFAMWACLGKGKCLEPYPRKRRRHCRDCLPTKKTETIEQVMRRIELAPDPSAITGGQ